MKITADQLAATIRTIAALVDTVSPIAGAAIDVFTGDDLAKIKDALADLQARGDALHGDVQAKLRG